MEAGLDDEDAVKPRPTVNVNFEWEKDKYEDQNEHQSWPDL